MNALQRHITRWKCFALLLFFAFGLGPIGVPKLQAQNDFSVPELELANSQQSMQVTPIRWPWRNQRQGYFEWWGDKVTLRLLESFQFRPGVQYFYQDSQLEYLAEEALVGGEIVIDTDILNDVDFPGIIENRLRDITIQLPTGLLSRRNQSWTTLSNFQVRMAGFSVMGTYWNGALAPGQFPQPGDIGVLFDADKLIDIAAREIAATSSLNNAVSLEFLFHPLQILTGFRDFEWSNEAGLYLGADWAIGWAKSTDLTFKQGRELLQDVDLGEEIRDALPDPLESLIDTDRAAELLLTAIEARIPLYGIGIPKIDGRTQRLSGWVGYQWNNTTWAGDVRLGLRYQTYRLQNEHPSNPVLRVNRFIPTVRVKWVFNKKKTSSSVFES